jgi:hypothetical protein
MSEIGSLVGLRLTASRHSEERGCRKMLEKKKDVVNDDDA